MLVDARRRAKFLNRLFDAKGRLFLDIGCSDGRVEERFGKYKDRFVGIDIDEKALRAAKGGYLKAVLADAVHLPFKDESFDGIICSEVMEHIKDDHQAAKEIARVLKRDRALVVSVPNGEFENMFLFKSLARNYYKRLENIVLHVRKGYTVSGIKRLFESESLRLQKYEYDLKAVGAFFHLFLWFLYSHQETKFRRFILRSYIRLLAVLAPMYSLDNILKREGLQIFARFVKV